MVSDTDLSAIERAAARGWPARDTQVIDGWMARASTGASVRGNSVAALAWTGQDVAAAIARVVAFYRAHGQKPMFTISDASLPADLDAILDRAGWQRGEDHVTMAKVVGAVDAPATVVGLDEPDAGWFDVYLGGLSAARRVTAPELVARVPRPRKFFSAVRQGRTIGSGLSVIDGAVASVQCMATHVEARRTGAARAVLAGIEAHAARHGVRRLYLQTEGSNTPAITLYRAVGYEVVGHYHTRTLAT
jgi:N-acetylglutamate synthase